MSETREDYLLRTSEVYRRLRAPAMTDRDAPAIDLAREATPRDTARALPQAAAPLPPPGPSFVRRLFTRPLDGARDRAAGAGGLGALDQPALTKALFLRAPAR